MGKAPVPLLLPLKRYAEFQGRSTRTELIGFNIIVMLVNLAFVLAGIETQRWVQTGLILVLFCPALALGVRRLHDSGRSGWWLLLAAPWLPATIWDYLARPRPWALPVHLGHPWWVMLPLVLCTLALAILLLLDDDVDTNRYGPNPRGWTPPPGEPA